MRRRSIVKPSTSNLIVVAEGRELPGLPVVEAPELAELVRQDDELALARAVARVVLLLLALPEERREPVPRRIPLVVLRRDRAGLLAQQEAPVVLQIRDVPEPFVGGRGRGPVEDDLALLLRDVPAVHDVRVGLLVVRREVHEPRVARDGLEVRLHAVHVLDDLERPAGRGLQRRGPGSPRPCDRAGRRGCARRA